MAAMLSPGLGVLKWPVDVLLYMLKFCSLEDSLSFSMVCKDIYTLASQKAFWITALKNERRIRPIACPYHEDFTMLDIHNLKRIGLHTRRLEKNWNSEKPQVLGDIKAISLGLPTLEILFHIPGTELYVFHCHVRGTVELWHFGLGKVVSGPFKISTEVCDISQAEDLPGKFTMALLFRKEDNAACYQMALISVEYGTDVFTLTIPWLCELPVGSGAIFWAAFLDDDMVGALCYSEDAMKLCVFAVNRTTGKDSFIVTDLPNAETFLNEERIFQSGTTIVDGNLCILIANSWVFTVPNSLLPRDENPDCPSMSILRFEDDVSHFNHQPKASDDDVSSLKILSANSPYGVYAMSAVSPLTEPRIPDVLQVTFWIRPELTGEEKHLLAPLTSESMPGSFYMEADEADSSRWENLVQTISGRRGLFLLNRRDETDDSARGAQILRLVSCEQHTKVTFRDLVVPDIIDLFNVHGLFLDDHLGVVSMIDSNGVLYTIPYA